MPTENHPHDRSATTAAALACLAAGAGAALQARANGALALRLGTPVEAALWSFGSGWLVLLFLLAVVPGVRRGLGAVAHAVRGERLQWWELVGGLFGGFFVAVQAFAVPKVGVALFTIAMVGGQTANALLVDRAGLGPAGRAPLTVGRVLAALATFVGVAVASSARSAGSAHQLPLLALALAVAGGAGMVVQQAINGRVNLASKQVLATTLVNFTWGTLALACWALVLAATGRIGLPHVRHLPWWSLVGGLLGVGYIAVAAWAVRVLGVLVTALMTLTGQLVTAVVLDVASGAAPVTAQLLVGVAITLAAATAAGWAARRSTGRAASE